ncbi:MAG TPA: hypothetical protein VMI54_25150 [Polyangiaceae bacterium]|nr:hypothetical protein [Polyangiaceae bacterium]
MSSAARLELSGFASGMTGLASRSSAVLISEIIPAALCQAEASRRGDETTNYVERRHGSTSLIRPAPQSRRYPEQPKRSHGAFPRRIQKSGHESPPDIRAKRVLGVNAASTGRHGHFLSTQGAVTRSHLRR